MISAAVLLLLALPVPLAQDPAPRVELEGLDGRVTERPLAGWSTVDPRLDGHVFVRYVGLPVPEPVSAVLEDRVLVQLHSGDLLHGRVADGGGERLALEIPGGGELGLSVDEIAAVLFPARFASGPPPEPAEAGDRLYRKRGRGLDRIDGILQEFTAEGVLFESRLGARAYPWSEVGALFVEELDAPSPDAAAAAVPVVVELRGQGRVTGALVRLDASGCRVATRGTADLFLPADVVQEVAVVDGSFAFLTQLEVADPGPVSPHGADDALGMQWPHRLDLAVDGSRLRAGGRTHSRGIGVHAPSRLTFDLAGQWKELRGSVAVDDEVVGGLHPGSVAFRVHVDGKLRWESPILRGGDPVLRMPSIALEGARTLVLEVDESTDLWISDRADWLRPILIRG